MSDINNFLNSVKKASVEAVLANNPFAFVCGTVTSVDPLKIQINQKMELTENQLLLTSLVRDTKIDITFDFNTEEITHTHIVSNASCSNQTHFHNCCKTSNMTLHFGLKISEEVMLLRVDSGQKFIVLDRVGVDL